KPDRKVYKITSEGINELKKWLETDSVLPIVRDEISSKIMAAEKEDVPSIIKNLDAIIESCGLKLDVVHKMDTTAPVLRMNEFNQAKHKIMMKRIRGHWKEILEWAVESKTILLKLA
ncbi:hypothetical protein ABXV21_25875, partial [Vibrio harveyi]